MGTVGCSHQEYAKAILSCLDVTLPLYIQYVRLFYFLPPISCLIVPYFFLLYTFEMDALQAAINAEMSKKRKTLETVSSGQKKKYVSRAELERIREEEYRKQEEERIAKENEVQSVHLSFKQHTHSELTIHREKQRREKRR